MSRPLQRPLHDLGWDAFFAAQADAADVDAELRPARVVAEHRGAYRVAGDRPEEWAVLPGRVRRAAADATALPAVGDWVLVRPATSTGGQTTVDRVLERRSAFTRKAAGQDTAQVVAANVDVVFVVSSLNRDFNPRRLERYLTLAWNSGAAPAVVLTKADLCDDVDAARAAVAAIALELPVHVVSARAGTGLEALRGELGPGRTGVLLGSSGVGKSTLVNALAGRELQEVRATLDDDRGVHTTTARQLLFLDGGGMLIDTPGMREVGLVGEQDALDRAFGDVARVVAACRFTDCRHEADPDCAVTAALAAGTLPAERWESYVKLQRELAYQATRDDPEKAGAVRAGWKQVHRDLRALYKHRRR
jgi:ribosome biogenesis GTPase